MTGVHRAAAEEDRCIFGVERQCSVQIGDGVIIVATLHEDRGAVDVNGSQLRIESHRLAIVGQGVVLITFLEVRQAPIQVSLRLDSVPLRKLPQQRRIVGNRTIEVSRLLVGKRAVAQGRLAAIDVLAIVLGNVAAGGDRDSRCARIR